MTDPKFLLVLKSTWTEAGAWPDFVEAMRRSVTPDSPTQKSPESTTHIDWLQLPFLCCEAVGGTPDHAQSVALAWGLLYTAAHLMDTVADQDEVPPWMVQLGPGSIINIATGLYATSALALSKGFEGGVDHDIALGIQNDFNRTILQMCSGQHLDLKGKFQDLETCWKVVQAKSGAIFQLACRTGAQLGTQDDHLISLYSEFGRQLGMMVQICDDAAEIWGDKDGNTRKMNCYSIPIAYTMDVLSDGDQEDFNTHLERSSEDRHSVGIVCEMIEHAGAGLYLQTKFQYHRQQAMEALFELGLKSPLNEKLVGYVNKLSLQV